MKKTIKYAAAALLLLTLVSANFNTPAWIWKFRNINDGIYSISISDFVISPSDSAKVTANSIDLTGSTKVTKSTSATTATPMSIRYDKTTSAVDDDELVLPFILDNSAGVETGFARLKAVASNVTSTSEEGQLLVQVMKNGSTFTVASLDGDAMRVYSPFIAVSLTATQASALTGVAGMVIYVTSTNGTFTSIGFWGYENGAWVKL